MAPDRISLAVTNHNRTDLLYRAIEPFLNDDRIDEIVISDDASLTHIFDEICEKYKDDMKVRIFRNDINLDCYRNKRQAVKRCLNAWVLLIDSDNIFDKGFIDAIFSQQEWNYSWAYAPEFARPHFDFREISAVALSSRNVGSYLDKGSCSTMLNAANYFFARDEYLRVWDGSLDPVTSDSLYQNYNWLKGGNTIYVTPGLQYQHVIHAGSHYQNNVSKTPKGFHDSIIDKLRKLNS